MQQNNSTDDGQIQRVLGILRMLTLDGTDVQEPLKPADWLAKIGDSEIEILKQVDLDKINIELKARTQDTFWILKRDFKSGLAAVKSYLMAAIDQEAMGNYHEVIHRFARALELGLRFQKSNPELRDEVIRDIENFIDLLLNGYELNKPESFIAIYETNDILFQLISILVKNKVGDPQKYIPITENLAKQHSLPGYWHLNSQWHVLANDNEGVEISKKKIAESYADMAEVFFQNKNLSAAKFHLREAIKELQKLGNQQIKIQGYKKRLEHFKSLDQSKPKGLPEEGANKSTANQSNPNRSEEQTQTMDVDSDFKEEIIKLSQIIRPPCYSDLENEVKEKVEHDPLVGWIGGQVSRQGTTIAQRKPLKTNEGEWDQEAVESQMYLHSIAKRIQMIIDLVDPLRNQIAENFAPDESNWAFLFEDEVSIFEGRKNSLIRGLNLGLNGDFISSSHILIPQIENILRQILKIKAGSDRIMHLDPESGIQQFYLLKHLLNQDEIKDVLGQDLVFDLRGLLIEGFGANLRNNLSHGLISDVEFDNPLHIYIWWIALHLCCKLPNLLKE